MYPEITVRSDYDGDWEVLYVDGVKRLENHNLNWRDVLRAVGIPFNHEHLENSTEEDVDAFFPARL